MSKIAHLSGHRDSIYALTLLSNRRALTGSADGMVVSWSPFESTNGTLIMKVPEPVYCLMTKDDTHVLAGSSKGVLYLGNLFDVKDVRAIQAHSGGIFYIHRRQDGWVTSSEDGTVAFWDDAFQLIRRFAISNKSIRTLTELSDGTFWCGSSDWKIYQIHPEYGVIHESDGHTQSVFTLAFDQVRQLIYSAGRDAHIIQRDIQGSILSDIPAHMYSIHHLDVHPEHGLILSCSMDKTIKIWEADPFRLLKVVDFERYESHRNCVNKVLWIDANHFISCADDRTAMVFHIEIE